MTNFEFISFNGSEVSHITVTPPKFKKVFHSEKGKYKIVKIFLNFPYN